MRTYWILILVLLTMACGRKAESTSTADPDEWSSLDGFHMIMAEAYHPYKDSANLEPAKGIAEEMAKAAEDWQKQPLPERVNDEEMKARLGQLAIGARTFADRIKAGADEAEIGAALTALHEDFHKVTEAWEGSQGKHEH